MRKVIKRITTTFVIMALVMSNVSINANAAPVTSVILSPTKIVDMALSKTGVVADKSLKDAIVDSYKNTINGTAKGYTQWCADNGYEKNGATYEAYLESDAYSNLPTRLVGPLLRGADILQYMLTGNHDSELTDSDISTFLVGTDKVENGSNYTISDEVTEDIRTTFNTVITTGDMGYYYVDTMTSDELPGTWFADEQSKLNTKAYIDSSEYITCIFFSYVKNYKKIYKMHFIDNTQDLVLVKPAPSESYGVMRLYTSEGTNVNPQYVAIEMGKTQPIYDYESYIAKCNGLDFNNSINSTWPIKFGDCSVDHVGDTCYGMYVFSPTGEKIIVYSSSDAMNSYAGGAKPYYMVTNKDYKDSEDNSVNFTGDYIQKYGDESSYDIVKNQIDNSVDNSDNSVSNIVNNSNTTIVNNYTYVTEDDDGNGENGGDGGNDTNVDNETDLDDENGLIVQVLNEIIVSIKALGKTFSGFTGLLKDMFPFIPTQLTDLLTMSVSAGVAIAIWRQLRR